MEVRKRNGRIVGYDAEKIVVAVEKAMAETEKGIDSAISRAVAQDVSDRFQGEEIIDIESIQDAVEFSLMQKDPETAKKYILYREERTRLREHGWAMTDLQRDIYEKKYRYDSETFEEFLDRVSGGNSAIKKAIANKEFMPAGRILAGRGLDAYGKKITLSNCYVMPQVEDNIESIYDTAKWMARTYSYGGGVGLTLNKLRPKGARVNNAASSTTGAVSFMDLYSLTTGLIGMRGRRGALMLNMDASHPDIVEFINVKRDLDKVTSANISVNFGDDFFEAYKADRPFSLHFEVEATGEVIEKEVSAREIMRNIAFNNWDMAEPGVLFKDRINAWHIMSEDESFSYAGVNPCAEEPLPAFGSCNLSSINLGQFVKYPFSKFARFEFEAFGKLVREGVVYLNEVLDENMQLHPLEDQKRLSRELRQIGLGIMGLADMFIKMGIRYGSPESLSLINQIGRVLVNEALRQSALLAKEDGPFPRYRGEKVLQAEFIRANADDDVLALIEEYGLRNSQLLTIAPTGSISTLIGCSNGVEPIFQISYVRKSESLHAEDTFYTVYTEIVRDLMEAKGLSQEDELPDYVITTSNLNYKDRINVQSTWQQFIDASISSTVNVPKEFTVEEVEDLYVYAWEMGLKGVTIYRDGCARSGILITEEKKDGKDRIQELQDELNREVAKQMSENPDVCPMCGGSMHHSGGCAECADCGYSPCAI
ncbi:ribonucleoside-diphosphate reductase alpha chain [Peptoniphilus ivorii]|uniref:adenosylcobalamin-dependent ribonucleoside-diphosphate reductase n=1 Tax=Aedoeadaptatus ivorii TaxID=54006 RepID=UPI002783B875|nr:adenosylcobalamin-dependent ribonucleoside-diphosphate reductase [Peptoniphilus ivorii]MDQ0508455.1 ribonucleoside-diphosphate reductase alpha chain [Peptoniphilus ivorii]